SAGEREVIIRFEKPSLISRDAPLSGETDLTVSLRRSVGRVATDEAMGAFSLKAQQEPALNLYLPLAQLQEAAGLPARANLLLSPEVRADAVSQGVGAGMTLEDAGLTWRAAGGQRILSTGRIFLSPEAEASARAAFPEAKGVLTYLVNQISNTAGDGDTGGAGKITPYSMATATVPGTGGLPAEWPDGSVVITQWLADDLAIKQGDKLSVKYFRVTRARQLEEAETEFTVHSVLPMDHPAVRREWTPDFPGVSESENCRDWKPGIPIDQSLIRDKDDAYWKERKGTPKLFLTLNDGQKMWSNRFGKLTSLWVESGASVEEMTASLQTKLTPAQAGLVTVGVKEAAGKAVSGSMDFGALFVSMSAFLIGTALLLAVLLFMFGTGQRAGQIGLLLASGWTPGQVRGLFVREALWVTVPAAAVGTGLGLFYTRWTLGKLEQDWGDAALGLKFALTIRPVTLGIAWIATVVLSLLAVWWAARRIGKAKAARLLAGASLAEAMGNPAQAVGARRWRMLPKGVMTLGGFVMLYMSSKVPPHVSPLMFFGAGALLLADGLRGLNWWLGRKSEQTDEEKVPGLWDLGVRNALRQRGRSMAMAALLAAGIFMVVALNAFRQDARLMPSDRLSGTGGFALVGTSTLPVYEDLDTAAGRSAWGLEDEETRAVFVVPFRAREGEEASCLNLNRAQVPRVLGVDPVKLAEREAFPIAGVAKGIPLAEGVSPWMLLNQKPTDGTVPAIMDQVSAMYALGKSVGDEITVPDGQGNPVRLRLVALVAGTVLQGNVIIGDAAFVRLYPDTGGFKYFLVDADADQAPIWRAAAVRQLANRGLAVQPTTEKLAQFQAVQNTYLTIFSTLGGLALVLSTLGLGVLVARHVLERKSEFALLQAVGFQRSQLQKMVLAEHWFLFLSAIILGTLAALIAVWPNLKLAGAGGIPLRLLAGLLISLTAGGLIFCHLAARLALSRRLTDSLRHE
ncbi:MAG: FtsX-like permease family protein, partial [Verrucomicrobiales bacterium]|nr:FtsX-like permease family protein [Verrucomicrobiales bacterium]